MVIGESQIIKQEVEIPTELGQHGEMLKGILSGIKARWFHYQAMVTNKAKC